MLIVVLLAPIFAVRVEKSIEKWRSEKDRKVWIFKTLMSTRATPVDPSHVAALNSIDLEFSEKNKKEKPVIDAWRDCMVHFDSSPKEPAVNASSEVKSHYQTQIASWNQNCHEYLIELLYQMGKSLDYKFNKAHLKKGIYYPKGFSELEWEQRLLRRAIVSVFTGQSPINMNVVDFPLQVPDTDQIEKAHKIEKEQEALRNLCLDILQGKNPLPVKVTSFEPRANKPDARLRGHDSRGNS